MPKLLEIKGTNNLFQIDWTVSNICNYNCNYCADDAKIGNFTWPNIDTVSKILYKVKKLHPDKLFSYNLLGGELTLWKDFIKFIETIRDITPNCNIRLLTNGRMPSKYWKKNGIKFDSIQFSFHARQTDVAEFVENLKFCSCKDINVFLMMDPNYWDKCITAFNLIKQKVNNVRNVAAKPIDNRAKSYESKLTSYTQNQIDWMKENKITLPIKKSLEKNILGVYSNNTKKVVDPFQLILNKETNWKGWTCNIGIEKLSFRPNGEITGGSGCLVGGVLGNWRKNILNPYQKQPVICDKDYCFCGSDIEISKKL